MGDRDDRSSRFYVKISCGNCATCWKMSGAYSVHELQAVESNPCPTCGAYTLCYAPPSEEPSVPLRLLLNERRKLRGELYIKQADQGNPPE